MGCKCGNLKLKTDFVINLDKGVKGDDGHSPYIGDNGNWYTWNTNTNAFVDTGVPAAGGGSGGVEQFDSAADFPATGNPEVIYVAKDTDTAYRWDTDTTDYVEMAGGGSGDVAKISLGAVTDEPVSEMKDIITADGWFMFGDLGSSWIFDNLSAFDFAQLSGDLHLTDSSLDRDVVFEKSSNSVYITSLHGGLQDRTYLVQNGTVIVNADTLAIVGAAIVLEDNFSGWTGADFAYIDGFLHFSRPALTVNDLSTVYRQLNNILLQGFRRQDGIDILQTLLLRSKIDQLLLENVPLAVNDGTVELPVASISGEAINPKYVGHYDDLVYMNKYIDATPYSAGGFFAFLTDTETVAIPYSTINPGSVTAGLQMKYRRQEANSGTPFTKVNLSNCLAWIHNIFQTAPDIPPSGEFYSQFYIWDEELAYESFVHPALKATFEFNSPTNYMFSIMLEDFLAVAGSYDMPDVWNT
jgi:hypothetical protein